MTTVSTREPQQERSRIAYAKTLSAATALYAERGGDSFTLKDVSARSGVSIGSIYGRFEGKEELIRVLHRQEIQRINDRTAAVLAHDVAPQHATLGARVAWVVETAGTVLSDHAPFLRASMATALHDPSLARFGKSGHELMRTQFVARLEEVPAGAVPRNHPEALDWSFTVFYSVVARYLGIGSSLESAHEGDWADLLRRLSTTITRYLSPAQET